MNHRTGILSVRLHHSSSDLFKIKLYLNYWLYLLYLIGSLLYSTALYLLRLSRKHNYSICWAPLLLVSISMSLKSHLADFATYWSLLQLNLTSLLGTKEKCLKCLKSGEIGRKSAMHSSNWKVQGAASGNVNAVRVEKTQSEDMTISFLMYV